MASPRKIATIVTWLVATLVCVGIAYYLNAPPMQISQKGKTAVAVSVMTPEGLPAAVYRVRLTDLTKRSVVWEIAKRNDDARIREFTLQLGDNGALPESAAGAYDVIVPRGAEKFTLEKSNMYYLELWGGITPFSKRAAAFSFE